MVVRQTGCLAVPVAGTASEFCGFESDTVTPRAPLLRLLAAGAALVLYGQAARTISTG